MTTEKPSITLRLHASKLIKYTLIKLKSKTKLHSKKKPSTLPTSFLCIYILLTHTLA